MVGSQVDKDILNAGLGSQYDSKTGHRDKRTSQRASKNANAAVYPLDNCQNQLIYMPFKTYMMMQNKFVD